PARRRTGRRRPPHAAPPPPPSPPPGLARRRRPAVGPRPRRLLRPPVARLPGTLRLPQGLRRRGLGPPLGSPHRPEGRLLRPPPGHPHFGFIHIYLGAQALFTVVGVALIPLVVRRLGWGYGAYTAVALLMPAVPSANFLGMGRYILA